MKNRLKVLRAMRDWSQQDLADRIEAMLKTEEFARLPDAAGLAPLLCAGLIGYRSFRLCGEVGRLGIYGFGAAAHILCQIARHKGIEVYAFTRPGDTTLIGGPEPFFTDSSITRICTVEVWLRSSRLACS